jgi:cyclin H
LFTSEALQKRKHESNHKAFGKVIAQIDRQVAAKLAENGASGNQEQSSGPSIEERRQKAISARTLSIEEEDLIKKYYATKIREFDKLDLPEKVLGTATIYFKRFFLSNAITHHDPRHIMLASMYLAAKVEEVVLPVDNIAAPVSAKKEDVLAMEIPLLEGIQFDLIVHLPYNPLHGFIIDLKESSNPPASPEKLQGRARRHINDLLITDAPFLYPPAQLALAALDRACEEEGYPLAEYIHNRFHSNPAYEDLRTNLGIIQRYIIEGGQLDVALVKKVDRKLKKCVNPEFIPGTEAYAKRREREQAERSAKRQEKLKRQAEGQIDAEAFLAGAGDDDKGAPFMIHSKATRLRNASGERNATEANEDGAQPARKKRRTEEEQEAAT